MAEKPETKLKREVKAAIEAAGGITFSVHGHAMQKRGWPDLYVAHPRFHGWIELKEGEKTKATPLQAAMIQSLRTRTRVKACVMRQYVKSWEQGQRPRKTFRIETGTGRLLCEFLVNHTWPGTDPLTKLANGAWLLDQLREANKGVV